MRIARGIFNPNHYAALLNIGAYINPFADYLWRYVLGQGRYPHICRIRTGGQSVNIHVGSGFDMFTVTEVFSWMCYPVSGQELTIVDFGANIGISMVYFLANARNATVYGFEPLKANLELAETNLVPFRGRYELTPKAVWNLTGEIGFAVEPTGRYSGIGISHHKKEITVPCIAASEAIDSILRTRGVIDILKVDIEGAEMEVLKQLSPSQLRAIRMILVEGDQVPLDHLVSAGMHLVRLRTGVCQIYWP